MLNAFGMPASVLLVGGTSEIGLAIVTQLVAQGTTRVGLAVRDPQAPAVLTAADLLSSAAASVETIPYDAADAPAAWARDEVLSGDWDCVILAVGILGEQTELLASPLELNDLLEVNFTSTAVAAIGAGEALATRGQGQVVILSSVAAVRGRPANFVYAASKAGLDHVGLGLIDHLDSTGVQVVVVRPGFVRTKMTNHLGSQPFATTADAVASDVVQALGTRRSQVVWSPKVLQAVFVPLRLLPRAIWRRMP